MPRALSIFNRHALFLVPILLFTFAAISGWMGTGYGFHNLFRDLPGEFCETAASNSARCPQIWEIWGSLSFKEIWNRLLSRDLITSINFQNGAFGVAVIALIWNVCVLMYAREEDGDDNPITSPLELIWPATLVLAILFLVVPTQISITNALYGTTYESSSRAFHLWGLLQTLLGIGLTLIGVYAVQWLAIHWSKWQGLPQLYTVVIISGAVIVLFWFVLPLMPGFAVFLSLATLTLIYVALLAIPRGWQFLLFASLAVLVARGQGVPFKHRFNELASYYPEAPEKAVLSLASPTTEGANLLSPVAALDAWRKNNVAKHGHEKPVLTVVAAAGGGYRAAYWVGLVLDALKERESAAGGRGIIDDSIFLFTGASGGMVAASYFVATRTDTRNTGNGMVDLLDREIAQPIGEVNRFEDRFRNARRDSLTPVVKKWLRHDLPGFVWQTPFDTDRGSELELSWPTLAGARFIDFTEGQREGWRPSIIFSPMLIDSGKPLLVSNLDLDFLAKSDSRALELFKRFPLAQSKLTLATAARMSASFPFVAPAAELPVENGDRVVDAGYYDNDGIVLAAAFLGQPQIAEWIREHTSGVVLLRINAFAPQMARADELPPCSGRSKTTVADVVAKVEPKADSILRVFFPDWRRSLRWITSPFEGAYVARATAGRIANEQHVNGLKTLFAGNTEHGDFFRSLELASDDRGSISWLLPQAELNQMRGDLRNICNSEAFDRIEGFWRARFP